MTATAPSEGTDATGVRPQDDLFGHVNGAWFETAEIPPDLPMTGGFIDLRLEAEATVGDLLREAAAAAASGEAAVGTDRQRIGDLFASFMDTDRVEALGADPLAENLAAIAALPSVAGLPALLGRLEREGVGGVITSYVNTDDRNSDRYIVNVLQGGIGLPDESYYREDAFADQRAAYVAHVGKMLRLAGWSADDADDAAARIMALETRLASGHLDKVSCRDVVATYHLTTLDELRDLAPSFDWSAWIAAMGGDDSVLAEVIVRQPDYLRALSAALDEVPLEDWKVWLSFHVVSAAAAYLSTPFVEENFDFYGRTLTGSTELRDRWKRGVDLCNGLVGEAVGQAYVAKVFPPDAKAQMQELVDNLQAAYHDSISRLDWMTSGTQERALEKLAKFRSKIGYPDRWRDYSALEIVRDDLVGNIRRATAFETDRQLAKIGAPVDRDEWFMTPQTVNAYYNPGANEICFPAAILQPPFFDPDADPALNYGGIGAVIGHEIGHGFDDQGSQYDGDGNLVNWWTDDDRASFGERAQMLIEQYDGFEPRATPGHHVNGALTVGENIGDLGGLTIGLLAYRISLGGADAPVVDGKTGLQRLFEHWGLIWRIKVRPELALQLLSVDPHSPAEFRANVVRNLDEFHEAYATSPGDALWLDPAERVRIW
ncbi:MAG: M13-type metalloendopeptidase [Actinomycetota bacterium]|nr:M13-type metalloendopeptidase [Actinomycetota bacterium]